MTIILLACVRSERTMGNNQHTRLIWKMTWAQLCPVDGTDPGRALCN